MTLTASTLILHEFAISPFAEKARLMLGYKGLAWSGVMVPLVMPKPDVIALTGGYRRTPSLQIGADIYCDTALIAMVLERLQPMPTLYPASAPLAPQLAQWADTSLFAAAVPWAMQPAGAAVMLAGMADDDKRALVADRAAMANGMRRLSVVDAGTQLRRHLRAIDAQLADGRKFLFGAEATIADFSVAHCLWFVHTGIAPAVVFEPHPKLKGWLQRMFDFGHGQRTPISSAEAIKIAAASTSHAPVQVAPGLGYEAGMLVTAAATDYGVDPVTGTLVGLDETSMTLRRTDDRAGTVHVHFPRASFHLKLEK